MLDLNVEADTDSVVVNWSPNETHVVVIGYRVYYRHGNEEETTVTVNSTHHTFTEHNTSQRVYTVSVQALSIHLPSTIAGPVTARGMIELYNRLWLMCQSLLYRARGSWECNCGCDGGQTEHIMGCHA